MIINNIQFDCTIDEVIEDTEHTVKDYIQCDGEYILNDDERIIELQKQRVIANTPPLIMLCFRKRLFRPDSNRQEIDLQSSE